MLHFKALCLYVFERLERFWGKYVYFKRALAKTISKAAGQKSNKPQDGPS